MHALPTVTTQRTRREAVMDREACMDLARRALATATMQEAAAVIRTAAEQLPETPPSWHHKAKRLVPAQGWREVLTKLANGLAKGNAPFKLFADNGNTKLPFVSWSSLPLFTCPGMGECAKYCYSLRAWRYPAGFARQLQNTLLMRHDRATIAAAFRRKVKLNRVFRLYVDGDFDSLVTVGFWMGLLNERPDVQAYGYSKSWALLTEYDRMVGGKWPANYKLNLSTGGKDEGVTVADMSALPITRGQFVAVHIDYRPEGVKGNVGFKRYDDPEYHRKVREAATAAGYGKVFSCPGKCGECNPGGHVCGGGGKFDGVVVAIGVH